MKLDHVLTVRPGALGDAVLTLPVVAALRRAGKSVCILGTPASWSFLPKELPGVWVHDFGSRDWLCLFAENVPPTPLALPHAASGLAIVYLASDGAAVARRLAGLGTRETHICTPPLLNESAPAHGPVHATDRLLEPLKTALAASDLALHARDIHALLQTETEEFHARKSKFDFATRPYAVLHPGSGGLKKCWPAEFYARLADTLSASGVQPVVLFGPADESTRTRFDAACKVSDILCIDNLALRDVLALLAGARGYAGNDSGVSHLAARVCPSTVLFGPTDPAVWAPRGEDVRVLRAPDGRLESIAVETVLESLLR